MSKEIRRMKIEYLRAEKAPAGATIICPTCGRPFTKKVKAQKFCSNGRQGAGNCKDGYWNKVDPEKRCRKTPYYYERIVGRDDVDEGPEGWDGHKDY